MDIDAVTLLGSEFDRNGKYIAWSPYANISTIENLEASQDLPYPTGKQTDLKHNNEEDSFFVTYNNFFGKDKLFSIALDEEGNVLYYKGAPKIQINTENPELLQQLALFLRSVKTTGLNLKGRVSPEGRWEYDEILNEEIKNFYKDSNIFSDLKIRPAHIHLILEQLKNIVDWHNTYLTRADRTTREKMSKNLCQYLMYLVSSDPANQTECLESLDVSTKILKDSKKGAVVLAMSDEDREGITSGNEKLSAPGAVITKIESIINGQAGKSGVSIGAVSIKVNSTMQFVMDTILNYGTDELKKRILFPLDKEGAGITIEELLKDSPEALRKALEQFGAGHTVTRRGYFINGEWYSSMANLYDKTKEKTGLTKQLNYYLISLLDKVLLGITLPPNVATLLGAMLSVAVDEY